MQNLKKVTDEDIVPKLSKILQIQHITVWKIIKKQSFYLQEYWGKERQSFLPYHLFRYGGSAFLLDVSASDVDPISLAIAKIALMRVGVGQPAKPTEQQLQGIPPGPSSSKSTKPFLFISEFNIFLIRCSFVGHAIKKEEA